MLPAGDNKREMMTVYGGLFLAHVSRLMPRMTEVLNFDKEEPTSYPYTEKSRKASLKEYFITFLLTAGIFRMETVSLPLKHKNKTMEMRIGYSTMIVGNMEESVRFYTEIMGFEVDSSYAPKAGSKITLLKGRGETMIELIEDTSYPVGLYSVGMSVKDLDLIVEKMRSEGVEIMTEITPTLVGRMAMIKDPNGIRYALIEHNA